MFYNPMINRTSIDKNGGVRDRVLRKLLHCVVGYMDMECCIARRRLRLQADKTLCIL